MDDARELMSDKNSRPLSWGRLFRVNLVFFQINPSLSIRKAPEDTTARVLSDVAISR